MESQGSSPPTGGVGRGDVGAPGRPDADPVFTVGNEFADIRVGRVRTRNGDRLLIESPRTGRRVLLCPLELQALTWQTTATFAAMLGRPGESLVDESLVDGDQGVSVEDGDQGNSVEDER